MSETDSKEMIQIKLRMSNLVQYFNGTKLLSHESLHAACAELHSIMQDYKIVSEYESFIKQEVV